MRDVEKVLKAIQEDIEALFKTIAEDDSFMVSENWIKRPRHYSANTIKDSKAVKEVKTSIKGNVFELYYADYLYYVNYGRHPSNDPNKKPPIKVILDWMDDKGIDNKDNKLVYAIRETIWKFGIKPRPIISMFVQNLDDLWEKDWSDKLMNEITKELNNYFN